MNPSLVLRWRNHFLSALILGLVFGFLAADLAKPINLTVVDIGRHIKNGELIVHGNRDVLTKNFYSFTYPQYPFINHHWLFGVMSYAVWQQVGFSGLAVVYIALLLMALFLFVRAALLRGHLELVVLFTCLALPLLSDRREIRPEGVSLFFMGLYFFLLTKLSLGQMKRNLVVPLLCLVQIVWVNTHIFFFMGPILVGFFIWEGRARGCRVCARQLRPLLLLVLALNVLNPSGLAGALTPFNIFKEFGYRLLENQNIFFMMSRFPGQKIYAYYLGLVVITFCGIVLAVKARGYRTNAPFIVLAVFLALAGLKAIRLISPFGFFLVPLGAFFYGQAEGKLPIKMQNAVRAAALILSCTLGLTYTVGLSGQPVRLGLVPNANASAEFFKMNGLKGPVFSNYDIGGYLIFHLADREKVFIDNRQEAFPPEFFKNVYMPMQEHDLKWQQVDGQYGFQVIYFYRHDLTPWGQNFLVKRIQDPQWAPVFVDTYTIILLKRNAQNQSMIQAFELPKSIFGIQRN